MPGSPEAGAQTCQGLIARVADRNKLPVDRITEVRVLDPYFYR